MYETFDGHQFLIYVSAKIALLQILLLSLLVEEL